MADATTVWATDVPWVNAALPAAVPEGFRLVAAGADGVALVAWGYLRVIVSGAVEGDGRRWLHLSASTPARVPHWDELVGLKEALLGAESNAVMLIPPRSRWVNIHPHCLHAWVCLDGDGLPDFTGGRGTI